MGRDTIDGEMFVVHQLFWAVKLCFSKLLHSAPREQPGSGVAPAASTSDGDSPEAGSPEALRVGTAPEQQPVSHATGRRGRPTDRERRLAIQQAIRKHGLGWRDKLAEIFAELDDGGVDMGSLAGRTIDPGDDRPHKAWKWSELDYAIGRERKSIIDILRKYVDYALRN